MLKYTSILLIILLLALTACQAQPGEVGKEYMNALARNDVDAMVAKTSDNVALVIDGGQFFHKELSGPTAMRAYLKENIAGGFHLELTGTPTVNGNQITYPNRFATDVFKQVGVDWVSGQDVLTIENGKVTRDVWTMEAASAQKLAAAFAAAQGLTAEKLAGTWRFAGGEGVGNVDFRYHPDGTYEMIRYIAGDEILNDKGTFTIEGDTVTLITSEAHYCKIGERGAYKMAITDRGALQSTVVKDACWQREPPVDGPIELTPLK